MTESRAKQFNVLTFVHPFITNQKSQTRFRIVSFEAMKMMNQILKDEQSKDKAVFIRPTTMWIRQEFQSEVGALVLPEKITAPRLIDGVWVCKYCMHGVYFHFTSLFSISYSLNTPLFQNFLALFIW